MQTVLFIIYGVLDWSDRVHEKYLFFMGIFIIGGIRLLLLLLKSEWTLWDFWDWDSNEIDKQLRKQITEVDGLEKNYSCNNNKVETKSDNTLKCINGDIIMNSNNLDNETNKYFDTLDWIKIYYYTVIVITILGMLFSITEFIITYRHTVICINNEDILSNIDTSEGKSITYKTSKKKPR